MAMSREVSVELDGVTMRTRQHKWHKWHRIKEYYSRGAAYDGWVRMSSPGGYLIELNGRFHPTGYLRRSEVARAVSEGFWPRDKKLADGDAVTVAVVEYDDKRYHLTFGLSALYERREDTAFETISVGAEVKGTVTAHVYGGAFVDLDGGGRCYLSRGEIPFPDHLRGKPIENLLYVGDRIRAKVIDKDKKKKRFDLSISALTTTASSTKTPAMPTASGSDHEKVESDTEPEDDVLHTGKRILVAENDPLYLELIMEHLRRAGHKVETAGTLEEARRKAITESFDFIVADISFESGEKSTPHVLAWCKEIGAPKAVFVTGMYTPFDMDLIKEQRKRVREALVKPLDWDRLVRILDSLDAPGAFEFEVFDMDTESEDSEKRRFSPSADEYQAMKEAFQKVEMSFPTCGVCLLRGKSGSREFECLFQKRLDRFRLNKLLVDAKYNWKYSPVGDVVFKGQACRVSGLSSDDQGEFSHFLDASEMSFGALIGEPVMVYGVSAAGVFVFYPPGLSSRDEDCELIAGACRRASVEVETARSLADVTATHTRLSASSILLHELGGEVGNLDLVDTLKERLNEGDLDEAMETLAKLKDASLRLKNTIEFFRTASRQMEAAERKSLCQIVHQVVDFMAPKAEKSGVILVPDISSELEHHLYPVNPIRQIMVNVILNAIVQILGTVKRQREIRVVGGIDESDEKRPVFIRVIDSANGIHAAHVEQVFDPYFTTRKDGTGLGLHICRRLALALGGEISVEESWMYQGTTFLLRLPRGDDEE